MYDMYGVWQGLSKLNMSLGHLQCLFPQTMGFSWRFFSCLAYRVMLGVCGWGPCPLFYLLNVDDLLLNSYLRISFA